MLYTKMSFVLKAHDFVKMRVYAPIGVKLSKLSMKSHVNLFIKTQRKLYVSMRMIENDCVTM